MADEPDNLFLQYLGRFDQKLDRVVDEMLDVKVRLNGELVSHLNNNQGRPLKGHIGLQNHHAGSRVQFRNLLVTRTAAAVAAGRGK